MRLSGSAASLVLACGLGAGPAAAGGVWLRYVLPGAEVKALVADPATPGSFFLGTAQGSVYRSTDGGRSWGGAENLFPGYSVTSIALDALHPATVWLGLTGVVRGGLLARSDDRGATFAVVRRWEERAGARTVAVAALSGRRVLAVGGDWGVEITEDDGETWRVSQPPLDPGSGVAFLAFDPSRAGVLWCGSFRHPFRSTDLGRTWQRAASGMIEDTEVFALDFARTNAEEMWAATCGWVYRSTNAGSSWTRHRDGMTDRRTHVVKIDPRDPARVLAGTTGGLFESRDSGKSFRRLGRETVVNALVFDPRDPGVLLIGTESEGVLRSEDGGTTAAESSRGLSEARVSAVAVTSKGDLIVARAADGASGGLFRLDPRTGAAERLAFAPPATVIALETAGEALLAATPEGVFRAERPGAPFVLGLPRAARALAWVPGGLLVATESGAFASADGGKSYRRQGSFTGRVDAARAAEAPDGTRTAAVDVGGRTLFWNGADFVQDLAARSDAGPRLLAGGFGRAPLETAGRPRLLGVTLDSARSVLLFRPEDEPREALALSLPEGGLSVSGWAGDPREPTGLWLATIGRGLFRFVPSGYLAGTSR